MYWLKPQSLRKSQQIAVRASYICLKNKVETTGTFEFVARIKDDSKDCDLSVRAKQAAARRNRVRLAVITITGVETVAGSKT